MSIIFWKWVIILAIFGPVPSRRLGRSLGINNIPPKICSYSCIYCQIGRTTKMKVDRQAYYSIREIVKEVEETLYNLEKKEEWVDYLTFVSDGEPTLDVNLGREIKALKRLGRKVAVISNASLVWRDDVRKDLKFADWVSLKIDAFTKDVWRKINRPHKQLNHNRILEGIVSFAEEYHGKLVTETMLVKDVNDSADEIKKIANFLGKVNPHKAYISIPIRPPAEQYVVAADESKINLAYQIFKNEDIDVEYLIGYEGNEFSSTGDLEKDVLSITSVHPLKKQAVEKLLKEYNKDWDIIDKLISEEKLKEVEYQGENFYIRKFRI